MFYPLCIFLARPSYLLLLFFSMHLLFVACINLLHVVHISRFKNILQVCYWPVLHSNGFPLIWNCLWSLSQFYWYILVVYILNLCKSIAGPYWFGTRWLWTLVFNHCCLQILRRCWSASFPSFHLITSHTVHRHSADRAYLCCYGNRSVITVVTNALLWTRSHLQTL
jgi:hypothetical protein